MDAEKVGDERGWHLRCELDERDAAVTFAQLADAWTSTKELLEEWRDG